LFSLFSGEGGEELLDQRASFLVFCVRGVEPIFWIDQKFKDSF
jgi:hypothetical protein